MKRKFEKGGGTRTWRHSKLEPEPFDIEEAKLGGELLVFKDR